MTLILSLVTQDYALMVSDRQVTFTTGPRAGEPAHEDTCKLVFFCGMWGIAYTGWAELQGVSTDKWIADRLSENNCHDIYSAADILKEAAPIAMRLTPAPMELTFTVAGWTRAQDQSLRPHFLLITNIRDQDGKRRARPGDSFSILERVLAANDPFDVHSVGYALPSQRQKELILQIKKMVSRNISPRTMLQELTQEIQNSGASTVGNRVLACCIPRNAVLEVLRTGRVAALAMQPTLDQTAFCYFDPQYSELLQYGPTTVCGGWGVTDVITTNDPITGDQSSQFTIRRLPRG